jgi:xylan 1,4-beta-xylosidase
MVWNYHDDDIAGPSSSVELSLKGIDHNKALIHHYRIDKQFSNSFEVWKTMGKPQQPTGEQYTTLERAGQLQLYTSPGWKKLSNGELILKLDLPRQAVSLIQFNF